MYAYTNDFKVFTTAKPYIALSGTPIIDLDILPLGGSSYARFIKNETALRVWEERSDTGLHGTWTKAGSGYLTNYVSEGPLSFLDNQVAGLVHVFVDQYGSDSGSAVCWLFRFNDRTKTLNFSQGYIPLQTSNINSGSFTASSTSAFPKLVKHGVVKPVTQSQYDAINAKW